MNSQNQIVENVFAEELEEETLKSENLRVKIILTAIIIIMVIFLIVTTLFPENFHRFFSGKVTRVMVISSFTAIFSFVFIIWELTKRLHKKHKNMLKFLRFGSTFMEISLPAIIMLIQSRIFNPAEVPFLPPSFLYFLIIIVSALRLDGRICVFAGAVGAAEYFAVSRYLIGIGDTTGMSRLLFALPHHFGKALMIFLCGMVTAIVTDKIRTMLVTSFIAVEERNKIVNMFGQHVSPGVVNKLLKQKTEMDSEIKYVCVMFLDIRGFTSFSEKKNPEEVVAYLNSLFDFMIEIINRNNGIINKFLGDGFMAVFGTPFSDGNDSLNAARASIEIVNKINQEKQNGNIPETRIGIGLHSGNAVTGSIGSSVRKEYTIIGDVVNLASRIEQQNKQFDTQVLISDSVWKAVNTQFIESEEIGLISVKGREDPVHIYKLV
jgi:adenylate cyclase